MIWNILFCYILAFIPAVFVIHLVEKQSVTKRNSTLFARILLGILALPLYSFVVICFLIGAMFSPQSWIDLKETLVEGWRFIQG